MRGKGKGSTSTHPHLRRTKIVATIGPASASRETLAGLLQAGMDAARLNLSHGEREFHRRVIEELRALAVQMGRPLAIILDTRGPEVRIGRLAEGKLQVKRGQRLTLRWGDFLGLVAEGEVPISHDLASKLRPGARIIVGDGELELEVVAVRPGSEQVECTALNDGLLAEGKRLSVPGVSLGLPPLSERDLEDLQLARELQVEYVAASFVRCAADLRKLREAIGDEEVELIAKVETREALENIEEILEAADGLMVARGDLGLAIELERLPLVQKRLIRLANRAGKPVITATQMLKSMVASPRPTRAEVTDVANAILDGTDAVMLSEETATGRYPVEAVSMMAKIAMAVEEDYPFLRALRRPAPTPAPVDGSSASEPATMSVAEAIGRAACELARDLDAVIITSTRSGSTAKLIAKLRPPSPIIAVTPSPRVQNKLALVWGVQPLLMPFTEATDEMVRLAVATARERGWLEAGERAVVTAGVPFGVRGITNLIKVEEAGAAGS